MNKIKYSFIVPCYNVEHYIDRCIYSLKSIDYDDDKYEIIAVNDGSTDNTLKKLSHWQSDCVNLKIISQENRGLGGARNTGISEAKGEWILFVDSDDWINSINVLKNIDLFIGEDVDIIKSNSYVNSYDFDIKSLRFYFNGIDKRKLSSEEALKRGVFMPNVWLGVYRSSLLKKMNYPFRNHVSYEDTDWTSMAYICARNILIIDFPFYSYFQRQQSLSNTINRKSFLDVYESQKAVYRISCNENVNITVRSILRDRVKRAIINNLIYSRNVKISDSRFVFKMINGDGLSNHKIYNCIFLEKCQLLLIRFFPGCILVIIKFIVGLKRFFDVKCNKLLI